MRFKQFLALEGKKEYTDEQEWVEAVKKAHPDIASKLKFKGRVEQGKDTISAEISGEDRSYGVFDNDTGKGVVLESGKIDGFVPPERKKTGYNDYTALYGGTNTVNYKGKEWIRTGKSGTAKNGKKAFEYSCVDDEDGEARLWVDVDGNVTMD